MKPSERQLELVKELQEIAKCDVLLENFFKKNLSSEEFTTMSKLVDVAMEKQFRNIGEIFYDEISREPAKKPKEE